MMLSKHKLFISGLIILYIFVDFSIYADDPSGKTKNTARLMELGNLKQNDPRYRIEFVKTLKDPSSFTGVKITPR